VFPVVLSREAVELVFKQLQGTMWIVAALLYGAGLRLQECVALRVKDLAFDRHEIVVRRGKGQKDRRTMLLARPAATPVRRVDAGVWRLDFLGLSDKTASRT
jgi:integrase